LSDETNLLLFYCVLFRFEITPHASEHLDDYGEAVKRCYTSRRCSGVAIKGTESVGSRSYPTYNEIPPQVAILRETNDRECQQTTREAMAEIDNEISGKLALITGASGG